MRMKNQTGRDRLSGGLMLLLIFLSFLLMLGVFLLCTGGHLLLDVYSYELGAESVGTARIDLCEDGSFPYNKLNVDWPCGRVLLIGWERDYYEIRDSSGVPEGEDALHAGVGADDPETFYIRACSSRRGFGVLDDLAEKDLIIFFPKKGKIPRLDIAAEELLASGIEIGDIQARSGNLKMVLSDCKVHVLYARGLRIFLYAESVRAMRLNCVGYFGEANITNSMATDCINADFVYGSLQLSQTSAKSVIGKSWKGNVDMTLKNMPQYVCTEVVSGSVQVSYPSADGLTVDAHSSFGSVSAPTAAEIYTPEGKSEELPLFQRIVRDLKNAASPESTERFSFASRYGERTGVYRGRSALGSITVLTQEE